MTKNILKPAGYSLNDEGCFAIENFSQAKPFVNFFPGIAGCWGTPMWVFYVNRGQGIASFGVESKDKAIMEFHPANKAFRLTSLQGFRTFLKVQSQTKTIFYEPFQTPGSQTTQCMKITSHDLTIEETNHTLGLKITVNYFTIPNESYAALARTVKIENLSGKNYVIEMLDGLPIIIPYGFGDWPLKFMSRTIEAWVEVKNLERKAPYYKLKVVVNDRPQVEHIMEGNFYMSFPAEGPKGILSPIIADPEMVFGSHSDFLSPESFLQSKKWVPPSKQTITNKTPCAFSFAHFSLKGKKTKEFISLVGHAPSEKVLNQIIQEKTSRNYILQKAQENKALIDCIKNMCFTSSSSASFDAYSGQTFLDNALRGGLPISLETGEGKVAFNVFSRKHGDPERDYNFFTISPTFFSQGNGNYRDVNQNRRNDIWFNKDVQDSSIVNFLSLIQADGYNPLVVRGMSFSFKDPKKIEEIMNTYIDGPEAEIIRHILASGFQPGELLKAVMFKDVKLKCSLEDFLKEVLSLCQKNEIAEHGEGFWIDHWTYNLDLIESFLTVYPEKLRNLLLEKKDFSFYHNVNYVLPREKRYILTPHGCRQYHSVFNGRREIKIEPVHKLHIHAGNGPVYYTTLVSKLLCLIANKAATFDPSGIGIEMEADKPSWYDALNGLPGLMGSSICETFELKRLCQFLLNSFNTLKISDDQTLDIFVELGLFISELIEILSRNSNGTSFWMKSNEMKERYRARVRQGIDGQEKRCPISEIRHFLNLVSQKCDKAISLAKDDEGRCLTYFVHDIVEYEKLDKFNPENLPYIWPLKFKRHDLPLFLEGFVHSFKVEKDIAKSREIYRSVRTSPLFDKKLKMYKVNAALSSESEEIGRARIFPSGWLENESIWLHMEYKFLFELLRNGLYEEFFENFKSALIPFLKPEQYGRSPLENSSFLVSSAHHDRRLHGQGFVSRLSGTTAEFVHMWLFMNLGPRPFKVDSQGKLILCFEPVLPGWLFSEKKKTCEYPLWGGTTVKADLPENTYAFNLFGRTLVVYHNPKRKNTYAPSKTEIEKIIINYPGKKEKVSLSHGVIHEPCSLDIREGKVERIDIFLR